MSNKLCPNGSSYITDITCFPDHSHFPGPHKLACHHRWTYTHPLAALLPSSGDTCAGPTISGHWHRRWQWQLPNLHYPQFPRSPARDPQGLWAPDRLPFLGMNNTTIAIVKSVQFYLPIDCTGSWLRVYLQHELSGESS
jgi:hypothetical protein